MFFYSQNTYEKSKNVATPIPSNKFLKAFQDDNYEAFEKLLNETYYDPKSDSCVLSKLCKKRTTLFKYQDTLKSNVFEHILSSNESKAAKFISVTLAKYKLWEDAIFCGAANNDEQNFLHFVSKSNRVENLFSFLMFDWFDHDSSLRRSYGLVFKSRLFGTDFNGRSMLEVLYEIIDNENLKIYQLVCLRIIYQFWYEVDQEEQRSEDSNDLNESLFIEQCLAIKSEEYREKILQVLVVFLTQNPDNIESYKKIKAKILQNVHMDERNIFFELAFMLKERKNIKFERNFEQYIKSSRTKYGDYYKVEIKQNVRLLFKMAEQQKMNKTSEFIFQKCPVIEVNSTIMTSFYDAQDFNVFNIIPFKTKSLNALVR